MRNKTQLGVLAIFIALALIMTSSCSSSKGNNPSDQTDGKKIDSRKTPGEDKSPDNTTGPTGYDDGGIQFCSVYYDGQLHMLDDIVGIYPQKTDLQAKLDELGAEYVGNVQTVTNFRWPSQDLEASRLTVSEQVYYNADKRIVYTYDDDDDGKLRSLTPYQGPFYELKPEPTE